MTAEQWGTNRDNDGNCTVCRAEQWMWCDQVMHRGRGVSDEVTFEGGVCTVVSDGRPTLSRADAALRQAEARGERLVSWRSRHLTNVGLFVMTYRICRCSCGEVVIDDDACKLCRALAPVVLDKDGSTEDLEYRYQLADRTLDRVAAVVATLKRSLETRTRGDA
ncbi:MAG: hypothetical protein ACTHU0_19235 [Kofleriaceae bacterium]